MNRREFLKKLLYVPPAIALATQLPVDYLPEWRGVDPSLPVIELEYQSPSQLMSEWGKRMAEGLEEGLNRKSVSWADAENCDPIADLEAVADDMMNNTGLDMYEVEWVSHGFSREKPIAIYIF